MARQKSDFFIIFIKPFYNINNMAEENQITIFTDFDKTMVKQNSPMNFLYHGFVNHPIITVKDVLRAFYAYGTGGRGFLAAISRIDNRTREAIANAVVHKLHFNPGWVHSIEEMVEKYPLIKNIKLVIITRNIALIADKFMRHQGHAIQHFTHGRYKGDYVVIGNRDLENVRINWPDNRSISVSEIINKSYEKIRFIKSRNAIFFGDKGEYKELMHHAHLENLNFHHV